MAGLLIRELKLKGLVEPVPVVCPANLSFQWQRELKEKFDEQFLVLKGGDIRDQFGVNQSLDFAKREENPARAAAGELGSGRRGRGAPDVAGREPQEPALPARRATPRQFGSHAPPYGHATQSHVFLQLLDRVACGDVKSIREAMDRWRAPFDLRPTKEAMVNSSSGRRRERGPRGRSPRSASYARPTSPSTVRSSSFTERSRGS